MGWRHDEKKARKLAESDPGSALDLIERVIPDARSSSLCGTEHLCDLLALEADLAASAGRSEREAGARAELTELCEKAIAEQDETLANHKEGGGFSVTGALDMKARYLARLGRENEANRLRLQAADVALASIGDAGAKAGLAATPFFVFAQGAMGMESSRAFRKGYESNFRAQAEVFRDPLLAEGKAIALAYCKRCGGVVEADWKKHRCLRKHKVDEVRVVPAEDADAAREELARAPVAP